MSENVVEYLGLSMVSQSSVHCQCEAFYFLVYKTLQSVISESKTSCFSRWMYFKGTLSMTWWKAQTLILLDQTWTLKTAHHQVTLTL